MQESGMVGILISVCMYSMSTLTAYLTILHTAVWMFDIWPWLIQHQESKENGRNHRTMDAHTVLPSGCSDAFYIVFCLIIYVNVMRRWLVSMTFGVGCWSNDCLIEVCFLKSWSSENLHSAAGIVALPARLHNSINSIQFICLFT